MSADKDRGDLVYDLKHRRVYVKEDDDGKSGYSVHLVDSDEVLEYLSSLYDSKESAVMAGLMRVGGELPAHDPRKHTLTVQVCRELWSEIRTLKATIHLLNDKVAKLMMKNREKEE